MLHPSHFPPHSLQHPERFINRLKNTRRVATRYDHTASSFLGFAMLATIRQWISFVHAAH
jgi:transposase